jgi:hypothetical protein
VAAWSVDQAARADPHRVERLFAAGAALSEAQAGSASSGTGGADVRTATQRRRSLLDELTDAALAFAASLSPNADTHRDAISATWEAASVDPEVQPLIAAGWLDKELPRPSGFDAGGPGSARRDDADRGAGSRRRLPSSSATAAPAPTRDELALRRAQSAVDAADEEAAEADAALSAVTRELDETRAAAEVASQRVVELEAQLDDARAQARDAQRALKDAERADGRARTARDRAQRKLDNARRHLADQE